MPTILLTGGSRGIGKELVKLYKADGWRVLITCRDPASIESAADGVYALEVGSDQSIAALKQEIGSEPIDLLWNNAGVYLDKAVDLAGMSFDIWGDTFRINSVAPLLIANTFRDNVAASDRKQMAFTTSRMGSIGELGEAVNGYAYRSSKTALNMAVAMLTNDVKPHGITTAMFHPGWVRTDMGGPSAAISPLESATGLKAVMDGLTHEKSGTFFNYDGATFPW